MKISYNWLREYVDVKNSAKQVAQWLTMAGLEVTSLEERDKDAVLEIEVTTNRPDWLSVIGVARELSAITGKRLKLPKVSLPLIADRDKQVSVEIHDKLLCPRYSARIIDGVSIGPPPKWLKDYLEEIGVRSINNVVDITNFCLFELGQPLHAFDYDKLIGQKIIVRKARKGEQIITIDGVKRELNIDMLVIADEKKPVAIAGVMGGLDTEVNETTKTVLLESAYFDPISIRRTQRKLGLSSDSSYRFERGVDLEGVVFASDRAAKLILDNCKGRLGILKDAGIKVAKPTALKLSLNRANRILGLNLTAIEAKKILVNLGLEVVGAQEELRVKVPSFRRDLKREEDLIEEIARIYGYEKIPTTIPKMVGHLERKVFQRRLEEIAKDILIAQGLNEVINYSLIDRKDLNNAFLKDEASIISIANPLSSEQALMRPSLIYGVLNTAGFNINRKIEDIGIFELSKVYSKISGKEYKEETNLCVLLAGETKGDWRQKRNVDFFEIKGIIEVLFEELGIINCEFLGGETNIFYPERFAKIFVAKNEVGIIGEARKDILEKFDIKKEIFLCEIKFEKLLEFVNLDKRFTALAKFIPTRRDISLVVEKNICVKNLTGAIKEAGGVILKDVELADEYFGSQIPTGKRGITFSLEYLSMDKQLTENEIEKAHNNIKEALVNKFGANIR